MLCEQGTALHSHLSNGIKLTKETAAFQLCGIKDPILKEMIENPDDVCDVCNLLITKEREGSYSTHAFYLLDGHPVSEEESITTYRTLKLKVEKHDMAEGAMRPEEVVAFQLRVTLNHEKRAETIPAY
ncbi:hypothetical protein GYMLUDRAFT_72966 [Collybiopsis luxurians FD-317 M1]|uniref:Uncharacterized protein n=1 Tax=Collybiopsis luxurians FD-317 M1 TaxID=944289 RepID=A0A0D0CGZ1_9AGAR|nr:hypothetical protein GYMLUDRAFT_72966 [Collybiopsis luxurians FD-317 M1]